MKNQINKIMASVLAMVVIATVWISIRDIHAQISPNNYWNPALVAGTGVGTWNGTITNNTACTNGSSIIDCRSGAHVALQMNIQLSGAGTGVITAALESSIDKVNWMPYQQFSLTATGNTTATTNADFAIYGIPWLKVRWITNNTAGASLTNYSVFAYPK